MGPKFPHPLTCASHVGEKCSCGDDELQWAQMAYSPPPGFGIFTKFALGFALIGLAAMLVMLAYMDEIKAALSWT